MALERVGVCQSGIPLVGPRPIGQVIDIPGRDGGVLHLARPSPTKPLELRSGGVPVGVGQELVGQDDGVLDGLVGSLPVVCGTSAWAASPIRDGCWWAPAPCSCGRRLTWCCECGAATYGPALGDGCSLLDGPARVPR